jgi:hypothetical protein
MLRLQRLLKICQLKGLLVISTLLISCIPSSQGISHPTAHPSSHSIAANVPTPTPDLRDDKALLDEIAYRSFLFFWQEANPQTGLIKDRANNFGEDNYTVTSIAAVGFGLTALCIGKERGWIPTEQAFERTLTTLLFFRDKMENVHGFYYHFVDLNTGERVWDSVISSIDTALFLAGVLVSTACFPDSPVETIANELYARTDFEWLRTDGGIQPEQLLLGHGWTPETGFLPYRWDTYSELMILYLLALGSPTHPIPAASWTAWSRPTGEYAGLSTFAQGPLFTHQYSQAFVDFRDQRDSLGFDYFTSSVKATLINRQFAIDHKNTFKTYDDHIWGLTASDGPQGYTAYGAPPGTINHDGTVSPAAPAGSIVFTPCLSIAALRTMYDRYGDHIWGRYGFSDAFNVDQDWYDQDVIGIDVGITLVMLQNHKNELVWSLFMQHPSIQKAMNRAGFQPD